MKRDGHENTRFFVGPEVEHTPAFSRKTLFVVGKQPVAEIVSLARENKATHVFMGANHSFNAESQDPYWNTVITELLDRGFWVTLDYPAHQHEQVLKMLNAGIWQSRIFVPMLSVRIPHVQTSSVNLTVKIDDIDFKATNAGVWCLNHHEVTDSNRFTDWIEYGSDLVIDNVVEESPAVIMNLKLAKDGVGAPVVKPQVRPVETTEVQNDADAGLDTTSKSMLKDDPNENQQTVENIALPATAESAAEAYAQDAKEDPLGKEGSKKKAKK